MVSKNISEITITLSKGSFSLFRKSAKEEYDISGISILRKLLSNEKARILYTIKTEQPTSIYDLAKKLGRGFKAVFDDVKLLQRFGFIDLIEERTKNRMKLRPKLIIDTLVINLKI